MNDKLNDLKNILKTLVGKDKLNDLFDTLINNIDEKSDVSNTVILLYRIYSNIKKKELVQAISREQISVELTQLCENILVLINELSESDLLITTNDKYYPPLKNIEDRIEEAKQNIQISAKELDEFRTAYPNKADTLKLLLFNTKVEDYLNLIEISCWMYLKNKINKEEFKSRNIENIKNIMNSKKIQNHFFDESSEKYKSIESVGKEWSLDPT
ncbi:MAG: hypothetical protein P1U56_16660 [Saprospiraceae bacterium]|nr:hypothetical protein [Saprospiraceae bacterium]